MYNADNLQSMYQRVRHFHDGHVLMYIRSDLTTNSRAERALNRISTANMNLWSHRTGIYRNGRAPIDITGIEEALAEIEYNLIQVAAEIPAGLASLELRQVERRAAWSLARDIRLFMVEALK